ncbi:sodium-dependent transporter [Nitrincola iocasae]|uniref:Sodium-dependent transporter n=1 Tax=Nitrincola iocasae TaxID=2614693 RepID=A0A5J6LHX2_9GAMM|nr:sodium-dependent transporter [Nitrincola iocasae]QEW07886.1 sodium-dependent transporter [Nitrincola iocasae]
MHTGKKAEELWSHRSVFILALLGSSAGLGNIWKFPYLTGEQGGGTFLLVYLFCVLLVGVPIMMAEVLLGRRTRSNPVQAFQHLSEEAGASPRWVWIGWLAILTGVLIFSFYAVVAAWIFYYVFSLSTGLLADIGVDQAGEYFGAMLKDPGSLLMSHSLFMLLILGILAAGVRRGLDRAIRYLMPLLFLLLLILLVYAYNSGHFMRAYYYLFAFHPGRVDASMFIAALGHAFFTLSLGMGAVMTYGAYLSRKESIGQTVACVGMLDTVLALLVGMVVFPIIFAAQMEPSSGPGLLFITLPVAFGQMDAGQVLCVIFFLLVGVAAVTSAISLMEPATVLLEQRYGLKRPAAALGSVGLAWLLSLAVLFSFSHFSGITLLEMNLFELLNFVTTYLLLPLVGLVITLFTGWVLCRRITQDELSQSLVLYYLWRFCLRYLAPLAIGLIFVTNLYNVSF